jgi:predicted Zn-dependent protease
MSIERRAYTVKTQKIKYKKLILKTLGTLIVLLSFSCAINPVTGQKEFMLVSEEQEFALGSEEVPNLNWAYGGKYRDAELESYLTNLAKRIWDVSERPNIPLKFTVQNTSLPNAFAIPGYIAITRGLLVELQNEAQFVSVMGHEAGHVMARHTAKRLSLSQVQSAGILTGSIFLQGQKGGDALLTLGALGSSLMLLKYDRNQELQADGLGVKYMARLGYDPREALNAHRQLDIAIDEFMKRLGKERQEETFLDEILSTHPRSEIRKEEIEEMISGLPPYIIVGDGKGTEIFNSSLKGIREVNKGYIFYDEAIRAFKKNKIDETKEKLNRAMELNNRQAPFFSLGGNIKVKEKKYSEAEEMFNRALSIDSEYQPSLYGLGMVYFLREDFGKAIQYMGMSLELFPEHYGSHFILGRSYMGEKRFRDALKHLTIVAEAIPKHPEVHGYLGICYENVNDLRSAYREYSLQVKIAPNNEIGRYSQERLSMRSF